MRQWYQVQKLLRRRLNTSIGFSLSGNIESSYQFRLVRRSETGVRLCCPSPSLPAIPGAFPVCKSGFANLDQLFATPVPLQTW